MPWDPETSMSLRLHHELANKTRLRIITPISLITAESEGSVDF